jgi:hypothetical protein
MCGFPAWPLLPSWWLLSMVWPSFPLHLYVLYLNTHLKICFLQEDLPGFKMETPFYISNNVLLFLPLFACYSFGIEGWLLCQSLLQDWAWCYVSATVRTQGIFMTYMNKCMNWSLLFLHTETKIERILHGSRNGQKGLNCQYFQIVLRIKLANRYFTFHT